MPYTAKRANVSFGASRMSATDTDNTQAWHMIVFGTWMSGEIAWVVSTRWTTLTCNRRNILSVIVYRNHILRVGGPKWNTLRYCPDETERSLTYILKITCNCNKLLFKCNFPNTGLRSLKVSTPTFVVDWQLRVLRKAKQSKAKKV